MDDESAAGVAALAACEALVLTLLEQGVLDGETVRESLQDAQDAMCEKYPKMGASIHRSIDTIVQQTYNIEIKTNKG